MEWQLTEEQKKILSSFLEDKDRDQLIEGWLKEAGISGLKAKLMMKLVLPALGKLVGGVALRGGKRLHEALREKWAPYDKFIRWSERWLLLQVENKYKRKELLGARLELVNGVNEKDWNQIDEEAKVWLTQLEQLNFIALSLGKLDAQVSLRIDKPARLRADEQPSRLLRYYNAFIPLIGRENEQRILAEFCEKDVTFAWQTMIGDGGIGKTRLALELAKEYAEQGWIAGFVSEGGLEHLVRHDGFSRWAPLTDTLIIVDYAASKLDALKTFFTRCAEWALDANKEEDVPRLRILLLERHADQDQGWLNELPKSAEGRVRDEIRDAMGRILELKSPGHQNPHQTMVDLLQATMNSWADLTQRTAPALPEFDAVNLRELTIRTDGRPLYLQMAALHACELGNAGQIFQWGKSELLIVAVNREKEYLAKQGRRLGLNSAQQNLFIRSAALLCLTGPRSRHDAKWLKLLNEEAQALGYASDPGQIADALLETLGETRNQEPEQQISPIYPDLVGEAFAVSELSISQKLLHQSLRRVIDVGQTEAWSNLLRATIDLYGLTSFEKIETWLYPLVENRTWEELITIEKLLPWLTVALREFAVQVGKTLLNYMPQNAQNNSERARILLTMGYRYSKLGRHQEALKSTKEAIAKYRQLSPKNPNIFVPYIAMSLNQLGNLYLEQAQYQEAILATTEAVGLYRTLAKKNSRSFNPNLASSLTNLGNCFLDRGKRQEALQTAKEAVGIYRRLSEEDPKDFQPDFAGSLSTLGNCFSAMGQHQEAMLVTKEAVDIYRRLTEKNPDSFAPGLAGILNNLGARCWEIKPCEEALQVTEEAIKIYRQLAEKNPDAFEPDLARVLINLGLFYFALEQYQDALHVVKDSMVIYKRLIKKNPVVFTPDFTSCLNNMGLFYWGSGQSQKALKILEDTVAIRRCLAEKNPDTFEPDVAKSLGGIGIIHLNNDCPSEGEKKFKEGILVLRRLFFNHPKPFVSLMAYLTQNYLQSCEKSGNNPDVGLLEPITAVLAKFEKNEEQVSGK